ncbi:hypothetical protein AALN73_16425 [Bacteroides stercorirosoris]|uniref:DUF5125 domain-containing protein n=2 Tax=Bacteroides stercorirosoris TaxID=871324 RepID=A0A1M6M8S1_9BACE|nr:hypothetical protein [Bacteroides stercorirosoris]SHJ79851.1 hypothetical protein SAMN05444350_1663 [Bacteroides stercorirosoris]
MKKLNTYLLALMSVFVLTWGACTDSYEYDPASAVVGEGVYFPSSIQTSITLEGTEGSFKLKVQRTKSENAGESGLVAEFDEGGENIFSIPDKVKFDAGDAETEVTIGYKNLVRGTTYNVKISFTENTSYGNSSLTFKVLYPAEVLEEWEVVSQDAVLIDQMFSPYGAKDIAISGITVEKEKNTAQYRFRSPYDADYFMSLFGETLIFSEELPYIILDGETYKNNAPGQYYIPATALGFKMVDGQGPVVDADWNTFGSVAGNLKTGDGPIEVGNPQYPAVSFDAATQMFDFGSCYHNLDGYGFFVINGGFKLYLDPALMAPDFDRDYTWATVEDGDGYFTSEIEGKSWMQVVQQAEEDPTFFRFTSLYAEGVHIYFNYDPEAKTLTMPKMQPTGLSTFGNAIYVDAVAGKCTVDAEDKFTFTLSFYLADEEGNKTAELLQSTETFLWGRTPIDLLQHGKKIDDYVGTWVVPVENGEQSGKIPVTITKADGTTLLVSGLSLMDNYDDTMALMYDEETGLLVFGYQPVASIQGFDAFVAPFNSVTGQLTRTSSECLVGGFNKAGVLTFVNNPDNQGVYDSMVYAVTGGGQLMLMSGFWNYLEWEPYAPAASFGTLDKVDFSMGTKSVEEGIVSKRTYKTELNLQAFPVQPSKLSLKVQRTAVQGFSLVR